METTLELPTKRACEEIGSDSGSGSGLEASKKAKADSQIVDYSYDEFLIRYGDSLEDPWTEWQECLEKLNETCKIREIKLHLISIGREHDASKIQSLEDDLACSIESSPEFRNKGWILRTEPGPFDDYQRIYCCNDEITGQYDNYYFTYSADLTFQKIFKELQSLITRDLSPSDEQGIRKDAFTKYKDLPPYFVQLAVEDIVSLKRAEQTPKEWVSLCTKFRQEVTKERNSMEVLIEIKEKDVASFPFIKIINNDRMLRALDKVMKYINSATKGEYSEEELIGRYFSPEGPLRMLKPDTYADYLEEKMQIAAKLRLTCRQQQLSGISESR